MLRRHIFIAPAKHTVRLVRTLASSAYTDPANQHAPAVTSTPDDITPQERERLEAALRVDQAGEVAANWIYMGQHAVLGKDKVTGPLIEVWSHSSRH